MKILITGGGGFLGAWIARRLLGQNHHVRIFDRATNRRLLDDIAGAAAQKVEWVTGDTVKPDDVLQAAKDRDGVVHLAALLTPACQADPVRGNEVNVNGTINVFEAARQLRFKTLAYASSAAVFGPSDGAVPFPLSLYGAYKLACEGIARAYAEDHGVPSVGFRPLVVYGPGREVGGSAGVSIACRKAAEGTPYAIPYTGETDVIYVDDVAAAFAAAALTPVKGAHVFNLRGEVASVERIIAAIKKLKPEANISAEGAPLPVCAHLAAHDIQSVLGPLPSTTLADGLRQTIAYYDAA